MDAYTYFAAIFKTKTYKCTFSWLALAFPSLSPAQAQPRGVVNPQAQVSEDALGDERNFRACASVANATPVPLPF